MQLIRNVEGITCISCVNYLETGSGPQLKGSAIHQVNAATWKRSCM